LEKIILHIFISPAAGFGMILLWAAMFGNTIGEEKTMFEEWLVCMPLYLILVLCVKWRKKRFTKEEI
jgi:hypothetical protein